MEGAMHQPHYAIDKRDHQWVVSVDGKELMCCTQKKKAVQMAREATHSIPRMTTKQRTRSLK